MADENPITDSALDTPQFLDDLFADKLKKPEENPVPEVKPEPEPTPEVKPEETPSPETKPEPTPEVKPAATAPEPGSIDEVQLPAHARGSTAQAFNDLKAKAKAQIEELQAKLSTAPNPEVVQQLEQVRQEKAKVEAELEELRKFRETLAAEGDPIFEAKFDAPIKSLEEEMYARLRSVPGFKPEIEQQIKDAGGFGAINLDALAAPGTQFRRFLDVKLARIDELTDGKAKAMSNATESRKQFLEQERAKQAEEAKAGSVRKAGLFDRYSAGVEKFKALPVDPKASPEERKRVEGVNTFIRSKLEEGKQLGTGTLTEAQQAELGVVYTLAHLLSAENTQLAAERATLQKQVSELQAKVASFKGAGSAVRKDPRPAGDVTPPANPLASAQEALSARFGN